MPTADTDPLIAELTQAETQVWEALVAGDPVADGAALCADFLGVYPDGFAGRSDHMEALSRGPTVSRYALSDFRAMRFGPDFAMLSYREEFTGRAGRGRM